MTHRGSHLDEWAALLGERVPEDSEDADHADESTIDFDRTHGA